MQARVVVDRFRRVMVDLVTMLKARRVARGSRSLPLHHSPAPQGVGDGSRAGRLRQ
jgi:hypothetical protein